MRFAALALSIVTLLTGCCSTRGFEGRIASLESENSRLRSELSDSRGSQMAVQQESLSTQRRSECILRHNDAKHSCDMLFRGEPNSVVLQNKLLKCLSNKGFPSGLSSCR